MLSAIQTGHFNELFEEPFLIKHGRINGSTVLFYGAERQTDMLTSAWLQSLICKVNATLGQPILVQSMLDWLMGSNPVNICLIESVGQENLPSTIIVIVMLKPFRGGSRGNSKRYCPYFM